MRRIALPALLLMALCFLTACFPPPDLQPALGNPTPQPTPAPLPETTAVEAGEESLAFYNTVRGDEHAKAGEWQEAAYAYQAAIRYAVDEGRPPEELTRLYLSLSRAYDLSGKPMRSLAVLLGARTYGAESEEVDDLIAGLVNDMRIGAGAGTAYRAALQALIDQHGRYEAPEEELENYPAGVFYATLIDCDFDGASELLCMYGVPTAYTYAYGGAVYEDVRNVPHVELYTYRDAQAVRVLQERVGYYFAQSDEGKEVLLCRTDEGLWLNFYLDTEDFCSAYYTVRGGNLVSHVLRAVLPQGESFDITDSVYDVALRFEVDGQQVTREVFAQENRRLREQFYGPDGEAYDTIYIPPDEFWTLGYAKQIEAVLLTLGG